MPIKDDDKNNGKARSDEDELEESSEVNKVRPSDS